MTAKTTLFHTFGTTVEAPKFGRAPTIWFGARHVGLQAREQKISPAPERSWDASGGLQNCLETAPGSIFFYHARKFAS